MVHSICSFQFIICTQCKSRCLSAYEVKRNCCLIERLFKVKKDGIFLFEISFFVLEIFTFLYYAYEESDGIIHVCGSTKIAHTLEERRTALAVSGEKGNENKEKESRI